MQEHREQFRHIQHAPPADAHDHLGLTGAQLADNLRHIVMAGLCRYCVNDLNLTPFGRQQAMDRPGRFQRANVLVGHQQDAGFT